MKVTVAAIRAIVMEFLGTFVIAFVSCWSFGQFRRKALSILDVALLQGTVTGSVTWAGIAFSGSHFNPVISILKACLQQIGVSNAIVYVGVQLVASFLGALLALLTSPSNVQNPKEISIGYPTPEPGYTLFQCFVLEFFASFLLVLVYSGTVLERAAPSNVFGFAVGGVYSLAFLALGSSTGGCINPAKVFGAHLVAGDFRHSWMYWLSAIAGGLFAGFYYDFFLRKLDVDVEQFDELEAEAQRAPLK